MKPEKKPAVKSAVVKSAVTTRAIERDAQRRQQAAHRIIDRMDAQRPHIPRLTAEVLACDEAPAPAPTLREELNAKRRREIGAPMATLAQPPMFDPDPVMAAIARLPLMLLMAAFIAGLALGRAL
ncbi:MAG TPA: hypothetical protein PLE42_14095 [Candidatus Competibacteraceae bacterium]|nr:hypothetical protein [Candidatus Competibacteraceae bacterium]